MHPCEAEVSPDRVGTASPTGSVERDHTTRRESMIVRTWRGWTRRKDTEAYAEYILGTGIVEYKETPGNEGAYLVSRPDGDRTEFMTISFWDSTDSIVAFAGEDIDRAVFYPDDDAYLIDRETSVKHFTVH
jgi:heme-degrading monooxygenase HmoA